MKIKEILDYVLVEIKKQGGRAMLSGACRYFTPDGKRCAFSLCCDNTILRHNEGKLVCELGDLNFYLKEAFHNKPLDFWSCVQQLHDRSYNWNEDGLELSEVGVEFYNYILEKYSDN